MSYESIDIMPCTQAWHDTILTRFVPSQVNELAALQDSALYSWAQLQPKEFGARILGLWTALFVFLGGPIAAASFEPTKVLLRYRDMGGCASLTLPFSSLPDAGGVRFGGRGRGGVWNGYSAVETVLGERRGGGGVRTS